MSGPTRSETNTQSVWAILVVSLLACAIGYIIAPWLASLILALALIVLSLRATKDTARTVHQRHELEQTRTDSERAEHSASALRNVVNAMYIPILVTDRWGEIVHVNRRSESILGMGQSMLGRRFDEIMPQAMLHEIESLARANEPGHARLSLAIAGEMREFDVSADPVSLDESDTLGAVLMFRDITELSRAMTLKADFVANASHELRTPIASIQGAIETLSGSAKDDEKMSARLMEMIASNATRLELLAGDLLDLSRAEAEDQPPILDRIELRGLVDKMIAGLESIAGRRSVRIVTRIDDGLDAIASDRTLVGLILRNLMGNAVKFAHEGTDVRVEIERAEIALDRTAPIPAGLEHETGIRIRVIDRGVGIPMAQQQRVFERFYQVDDARTGSGAKRGTGLGLAIVKHASRRLGGSVRLESVHQEGTTVTVELPRCAYDANTDSAPDTAPSPDPSTD